MPDDALRVQVALGPRSYEILIVSQQLARLPEALRAWRMARLGDRGRTPGTALVVTDRHVAHPYAADVLGSLIAAGWTCSSLEIEPGEPSKSLDVVTRMYDRLVEMRADRQTVVFAVGGGVVGDAAGFAAATYARGLPFVQVPTSLLAQVDSSVGGKVGVNHPRGKNLIGAFHQPLGVYVDTSVLKTLPERDYRSGLAEVVKYGVILDAEFFAYLEANVAGLREHNADALREVVARSCRLKADVVEQDELETTGLRAALNYGHTFAHAFEARCGYGELMHGEAVSIGMICASRLAERLRLVGGDVTARQLALLRALELPVGVPESLRGGAGDLLESMRLDKKAVNGRLRFVLPTRIGQVQTFGDVSEEDVRAVLEET